MRKVASLAITSWSRLSELIEACAKEQWIFRGEANDRNPLRPKSGRVGPESGSSRKKEFDENDEKAALESFKRQARPYLTHNPVTDLEWLAIAQHHGMSTRLLDWTESLLVAAYFAVEKAGTKGNAVIYGVKNLRTISSTEEKRPFAIKSPGIYRPPHIAARIPAQRSIFTVHPSPTDTFAPKGLERWVISRQVCSDVKRILDACAINESSLFPDMDGLSRYLGWRYKWGKF